MQTVVRDIVLTTMLHIELIDSCARHNQKFLGLMNTFNLMWYEMMWYIC